VHAEGWGRELWLVVIHFKTLRPVAGLTRDIRSRMSIMIVHGLSWFDDGVFIGLWSM